MLEVLYSTGLRVSELIGLGVSDLDAKVGCVRCIGKGDKERIVPVGKKALSMVDKYLREGRPQLLRNARASSGPALFVTPRGPALSPGGSWKIVSAYRRRARMGVRLTPGIVRHRFAPHCTGRGCEFSAGQVQC